MNSWNATQLVASEFPRLLLEIPQPPKDLWVIGNLPPADLPLLAVVGARQYTTYGRQVVDKLIADLATYEVGIVSGLAIGIDGLAHEAALRHKLYTLAVPGSGLAPAALYPARHRSLAEKIVENGGGLLSELPPATKAAKWTFPARNRIMAGLCPAILLIEAGAQSGTLITARMAVDYNRELLVVPGSIFSPTSYGTHQFLKLGATPVTTAEDIVQVMGLRQKAGGATPRPPADLSTDTLLILKHLREPLDKDSLIRLLDVDTSLASIMLMEAELAGHIALSGGVYTALINIDQYPIPDKLFDR